MPTKMSSQAKVPTGPRDFVDKHGVARYPVGNFQMWGNRQHTQPVHNTILGQSDHERGCRMKWFDKFGSRIDKYKTITGKSSFYMEPGWSKKAASDVKEAQQIRRKESMDVTESRMLEARTSKKKLLLQIADTSSKVKPLGRFPSILNETIRTREIGRTRISPIETPLPGGISLQYPVNPKEYLPLFETPTVDMPAGKKEYLRQRYRIMLKDRMVSPATTSMEYGWNLGGEGESFYGPWLPVDKVEQQQRQQQQSFSINIPKVAERCSRVHGQIEKQFWRSQSGTRDTFNTTHERIADPYGMGKLLQDHV